MEPPAKRSRQGPAPYDDADADDELFLEPEEINAQRDPAVQLEQSRAVAAYKLKSRWEHIFEKYGKDFTDEGDEIDIATGEVVVDNGHIRSLDDADDTKSVAPSEGDMDEEERILHGKGGGGQLSRLAPGTLMRDTSYHGQLPAMSPSLFGTPRLSTMFSPGIQFPTPLPLGSFRSFSSFVTPNKPVESTWEVPELPIEAYEYSARAMSKVIPRKVARRSLAAVQDSDGDDDDILMGNSSSRGQGTGKPQAVSPIAPAVAPPARLLLTQTPATPAPKSQEPSSTVDEVSGQELTAHLAAALHAVDDSPEGSRLPTPPPTDQESNMAPVPREPTNLISTAMKRSRRRIEVVIVQYSKKLPIPPDVVAEDTEDASIPESDAQTVESSGDADNISAVLPSGGREPVVQQSSATDETTTTANEAACTPEPEPQTPELQLPEPQPPQLHPPQPVTPTEAAQPAEMADAVQAETPPSVRHRRRDRINPRLRVPESSELTHRPIRHARQSDVQTKLKKPSRQSLPCLATKSKAKNSAIKNRRHTLPAAFPDVQPGSTANDYQDDDIFDIPQDDDIILEQQDQQTPGEQASRPKAPRQEKASQQPGLAPAPVIEQFSRNMIDSAYGFSDEEELFLPRQGKQTTVPNNKQASVSQQAPAKRRGRPPKVSKPPPPREQSPPPKPSPPRGKSFRSDGKRLPTTEKPGDDIIHDNRQLFAQGSPSKSLPPASRKPTKLAQRLFDMRKQVKESRITDEPASSPLEKDVAQEQPLALDQRGTTVIETPVPVPKSPPIDRRLAMRRKHLEPSTGIEELPSSPPRLDFVQEHSPVPDQTLAVETPVSVPPVPHVKGSVVRKRRHPEPSHEVEEGLPSSSSRVDAVQEHEPVLDQTSAIETPLPTPIIPRVDSSPTKRRKRPSAPTTIEELPTSPAGIDLIHPQSDRQPKTPSHRTKHKTPTSRLSSSRPSTSKQSIISLVSDDEDEDELSLTLEQISPLKVQSDGKKRRQSVLSQANRNRKPATPNPASSVKRSAINRARMLRTHKNKARWRRSTGMSISSPAADLVRTPGGTMRKCGEDGFKCERDFCFVCL